MNSALRGPLLAFTLFALLASGWLFVQSSKQEEHYRNTAVPWIESSLEQIASDWHSDDIWPLLAPEAKAVISEQQLEMVMAEYAPLGGFLRLQDPRFSRLASMLSLLSSEQRIGYSGLANFENGDAVITLTLLEREGRFYIYNISLDSP